MHKDEINNKCQIWFIKRIPINRIPIFFSTALFEGEWLIFTIFFRPALTDVWQSCFINS